MKRLWVMLGVGAAVAACGGGGSGGGVGSGGGGAGGGGGGAAATQIAFVIPAVSCSGSGTSFSGVDILISTNRVIADACTHASDVCVSYANVSGIVLSVINFDLTGGTAGPVVPGTYDVAPLPAAQPVGTLALAGIDQTDANCNPTLTGPANASGTITITAVSGTSVTGSYDVTAYGNHYAGSFDAGVCTSGVFQGDLCQSSGGTCTGTKQCL